MLLGGNESWLYTIQQDSQALPSHIRCLYETEQIYSVIILHSYSSKQLVNLILRIPMVVSGEWQSISSFAREAKEMIFIEECCRRAMEKQLWTLFVVSRRRQFGEANVQGEWGCERRWGLADAHVYRIGVLKRHHLGPLPPWKSLSLVLVCVGLDALEWKEYICLDGEVIGNPSPLRLPLRRVAELFSRRMANSWLAQTNI